MKKLFKSAACILLALVMALSCASAFAASDSEKLIWNFEQYEEEYTYGGNVSLGENIVEPDYDGSYYQTKYYVFDVEKAGYYSFDTLYDGENAFGGGIIPDRFLDDGRAYIIADRFFAESEKDPQNTVSIFYLEEGQHYVGVGFRFNEMNDDFGKCILDIRHYADAIEKVELDSDSLENIVMGVDFDVDYVNSGRYTEIAFKYNITFTNGKKMEFDCDYARVRFKNKVVEGENEVIFMLPGYEEEITVTAYPVNKLIKKISISNIEKYTAVSRDYIGNIECDEITDEILMVEFTNDKTKSYAYDWGADIDFGNCRSYYVQDTHYEDENGDVTLNFAISSWNGIAMLLSVPCTVKENTVKENFGTMISSIYENTGLYIRLAGDYFSYAFDKEADYDLNDRLYFIQYAFGFIGNIFRGFFGYIVDFTEYYL